MVRLGWFLKISTISSRYSLYFCYSISFILNIGFLDLLETQWLDMGHIDTKRFLCLNFVKNLLRSKESFSTKKIRLNLKFILREEHRWNIWEVKEICNFQNESPRRGERKNGRKQKERTNFQNEKEMGKVHWIAC